MNWPPLLFLVPVLDHPASVHSVWASGDANDKLAIRGEQI